jgi:hypothetical protein
MRRNLRFVCGLLLALWGTGAYSAAPDASPYDGKWGVVLHCPRAPDGALPWTFYFTAEVTGGILHGEHGVAGRPGWLSLDGPIAPDGAANLEARGLTGDPHYNINQTAQLIPYRYDVSARFEAARGTGNWVTTRVCNFTFTRP